MDFVIRSELCMDVMLKLKTLNTFLCFHCYSTQRFELFNNINNVFLSFTQLDTKEQVNFILYGYPPNKSNTLNQDIINY